MENDGTVNDRSRLGRVIFLATTGAAIFFILTRFIPIYEVGWVSAIYELLWLPAMFILYVLPLFSFLLWAGQKFKFRSIFLVSLLLALSTMLFSYLLSQ